MHLQVYFFNVRSTVLIIKDITGIVLIIREWLKQNLIKLIRRLEDF